MKEESFYVFWQLFAPEKEFSNRYRACEQLWHGMNESSRRMIFAELKSRSCEKGLRRAGKKNPYFYLADWRPRGVSWLQPAEIGRLLDQEVPLAVCRNPDTGRYGTVTKEEAELFGLEVHHEM